MRSYCGELYVLGDVFELVATRFIPRRDGVSFQFSGIDELGRFSVDGVARKIHGVYVVGSVPVSHGGIGIRSVTIDFESVRVLGRHPQTECRVMGVWIEGGLARQFKGDLAPFKPTRPVQQGGAAEHHPTPAGMAIGTAIVATKRKLVGKANSADEKVIRKPSPQKHGKKSTTTTRKPE